MSRRLTSTLSDWWCCMHWGMRNTPTMTSWHWHRRFVDAASPTNSQRSRSHFYRLMLRLWGESNVKPSFLHFWQLSCIVKNVTSCWTKDVLWISFENVMYFAFNFHTEKILHTILSQIPVNVKVLRPGWPSRHFSSGKSSRVVLYSVTIFVAIESLHSPEN